MMSRVGKPFSRLRLYDMDGGQNKGQDRVILSQMLRETTRFVLVRVPL